MTQPEQYNNYVIAYYDGSLTQTLVASTDPFTAIKAFLMVNDFDISFYNSLNLEDLLDQININPEDRCISIVCAR
jgi:hypothetical protein